MQMLHQYRILYVYVYSVFLMKNDKCCQLVRMVARAAMYIIRSYLLLTYRYQVVVVLLVGVDGVIVAVAADNIDIFAVVYPGVVGVDRTDVSPVPDPAEAVLAGGRNEVSEGLVPLCSSPPPSE